MILTSKSLSRQAWCKFCRLQLPKVLRRRQFLTILTSKPFSRAGVVQILSTSTSKSALAPSVFNDFDFQIALAQAWCKFCRLQLPKVLRRRQFLTILTSKAFSRAGVVQILSTSTSKSALAPAVFNDFDFQIALARRRGANFEDFNFQKCSEAVSF